MRKIKKLNLGLLILILVFVFLLVLIITGQSLAPLSGILDAFGPVIVLFLIVFFIFVFARNWWGD